MIICAGRDTTSCRLDDQRDDILSTCQPQRLRSAELHVLTHVKNTFESAGAIGFSIPGHKVKYSTHKG